MNDGGGEMPEVGSAVAWCGRTIRSLAGLEAERQAAAANGHHNRADELEGMIVEAPVKTIADAAALAALLDELLEGSDLYPDGRDRRAATRLKEALERFADASRKRPTIVED